MTIEKKSILLICGGQSSEHEVSIRSAQAVCNALDASKYRVFLVGIQRNGQWRYFSDSDVLFGSSNLDQLESGIPQAMLSTDGTRRLFIHHQYSNVQEIAQIDCVVPILHGPQGEDGTIQGLFEIANLPYVGCDVRSSSLCMDKSVQKDLLSKHGINQTLYCVAHRFHDEFDDVLAKVDEQLTYPLFVKPANMGSSVGITKVNQRDDLSSAIDLAYRFDEKVIIEQSLEQVHELECAVMGNKRDPVAASVIGEIIPGHAFYDYETKYIDDLSELIIPAEFHPEVIDRVRHLALEVYRIMECSGLARVDLFMDKNDHKNIYVNEINTMPGFTSISMYPKLWQESGVNMDSLVDKLIHLAMDRYQRKKALCTTMV